MFYFRINKIKIIDNETRGFWFFKRDLTDVKIISFVTTGNEDIPELDSWIHENDSTRKKEILSNAITNLAASRILTTVEDVKDNQQLFFGDTGYNLFQSEKIPNDFNWCFLVVKSNRDLNELGELISEEVNDDEFDSFAENLSKLINGVANPAFKAGVEVAKYTTSLISKIMEEANDEQIGIMYMSLNRFEHYLHGERKKDDVSDLSGNLKVDYSIFAVENQN